MIRFQDVDFTYPTRPGSQILKGLNLVIPKGQVVGLVGGSGGGKSTLLRLISRFYETDKGRLFISGHDIRTIPPAELSQRIAWVTQEPQLFPISIAENIAYGYPPGTWTMDDIIRVAKLANVDAFVRNLPNGYETTVGEGGRSLSGGQKQRVAIARALLRDPEILLLDEPTSALDAESEAYVQSAFTNAFAGRTVLIVAHRLSTIQSADRVIVLSDGRVVEDGKPEMLREDTQGAYHALLQQQALVVP